MSGADVPVDTERKQNPGRIFHGRKQRENEPEMIEVTTLGDCELRFMRK